MSADCALIARFGPGPAPTVARAPGRVNLIGEHTDYNDGFVLPTPIDRFVEAAARPRSDRLVRMLAADLDEVVELELGAGPAPAGPEWAPYLFGLVEELRARGLLSVGLELSVRGNVPQGAGLSSSAALETAALLALQGALGFRLESSEAIELCRHVEHRWAGVHCGVMDQMVSRLGRRDHGLLIDCRDRTHRQVPLRLGDHRLVIVDSGVRRRLGDSAYNRRREECEQGVALLRTIDDRVRSLRDVDAELLDAGGRTLPGPVAARCRHVVEENARVLEAESRLNLGDLKGLGELMTASHESLRDLYEVSHPALDRLVAGALGVPGVLGSRLCGAGFGGCTVTLCSASALDPLRRVVRSILDDLETGGEVLVAGAAIEAGLVG